MAGSLGYADRLKPKRKLGGQLGAPEYFDDVEDVARKCDSLAKLVREESTAAHANDHAAG
jgi:NAD+-dependent protein deacetylase sirtuin 6